MKNAGVSLTVLRSLLQRTVTELGLDLDQRALEQMSVHFSLLLKWNEKMNLSSLKTTEEIATRHFGESLFLAKLCSDLGVNPEGLLVDIGSGAGFPGLPLKIAWPGVSVVLVESSHKKATFLKEVVRSAKIEDVDVRASRLEEVTAPAELSAKCLYGRASVVTMRAVALSAQLLADLRRLLQPLGTVALFLGMKDAEVVKRLPGFRWSSSVAIPHSDRRVILIGHLE